jgi:hypothetical protein
VVLWSTSVLRLETQSYEFYRKSLIVFAIFLLRRISQSKKVAFERELSLQVDKSKIRIYTLLSKSNFVFCFFQQLIISCSAPDLENKNSREYFYFRKSYRGDS